MPELPSTPPSPEERWSLLLSMERLGGRVDQALSQISSLDVARSDHEARLRAVEQISRADHEGRLRTVEDQVSTARGRGAILGVVGGGVVSLIVVLAADALKMFGA